MAISKTLMNRYSNYLQNRKKSLNQVENTDSSFSSNSQEKENNGSSTEILIRKTPEEIDCENFLRSLEKLIRKYNETSKIFDEKVLDIESSSENKSLLNSFTKNCKPNPLNSRYSI